MHFETLRQKKNIYAASLGCGQCGGAVKTPPVGPTGDPFQAGPYKGRYWCMDCWTLYWDAHPEHLADEDSRRYVADEALQVRLRRGAELLFEEGDNRVFLTDRGTLVFDISSSNGHGLSEYDPDRFGRLVRALKGVNGKVPGYEFEGAISA